MTDKKLLFIVNIPEFFISHRLSLALLAKKKGYQVHVATSNSESYKKIENYGFHCHKIFLKRGSLNIFYEFLTFISIYRVLKNLRPDVIHLLTAKCNIYGGLASKIINVPKIIHAITGLGYIFIDSNNNLKNILKNIVIFLFKVSIKSDSLVIFQNKYNLDLFIEKGIIKDVQGKLIHGSGVNTEVFFHSNEIKNDNPIVLFPSRLLKEKGVETFVKAAIILQNKIKLRMIIAGDLDNENPSAISRHQIEEWVSLGMIEWYGHVVNMPDLLSKSSIVCLPTYYPEGIPKALIEAASCGRAIITTDMPGCNEIVENNINGVLIPIKSPERLADEIVKLIENFDLRKKYGNNGRKRVIDRFSSKIVDNATIKIYSD